MKSHIYLIYIYYVITINFRIANLENLENLLQNSKNRSNHGVLHILKRTFKHLFRKATRVYQYTARNVVCYVGSYMIQKLIDKRRSGTSKEEFGQFIKNICIVLKIEPEPVCVKTIDLHIVSKILLISNILNSSVKFIQCLFT